MSNLQALLERVEKAEGPDREIDRALLDTLEPLSVYDSSLRHWDLDYPALTASIDAAVGLVEKMLQDCSWNIEREHYYDKGVIRYRYIARLRAAGSPRLHVVATLSTPALALIAALLKAMISQSNPERPGVE